MEQLDLLCLFTKSCEQGQPLEEVIAVFESALRRLGFRYYACCSHVDPLNAPCGTVMLHNYPEPWVCAFSSFKLHERDPVFMHAERSAMPFHWDAPAFRAQLTASQAKILAVAGTYGIAHGYTSPIRTPTTPGAPRASFSLVPGGGTINDFSFAVANVMASHLYLYAAAGSARMLESAYEPILITRRQREVLTYAAVGKTNPEIAQLLGLSEETVHKHIEKAKRRFDVTTRILATHAAVATGQIPAPRVGWRRKKTTKPK